MGQVADLGHVADFGQATLDFGESAHSDQVAHLGYDLGQVPDLSHLAETRYFGQVAEAPKVDQAVSKMELVSMNFHGSKMATLTL